MKVELKKNWPSLAAAAAIILVISVFGAILTLYFLSATPTGERVRNSLGLSDLKTFNINSTKTERIIVEESSAIIDASKNVSAAVVSITSVGKAVRDVFGLGTIEAPKSSGTGFIVTSDGLIATNKHVVDGGESFTVTTAEGKNYDGQVVGKDPTTDIALIKIDARGLPVADLGDSDRVQIGQWVIAIGNALGEFQNTVTVGVISGLNRKATPADASGNAEALDGLIQTDAAINPGNSGGPLLTLKGQVIGINTAISGNAQNIGFVITVNELKKSLDSYRKNGKILRPYIGVRYQTITSAVAKNLELPVENGALLNGSDRVPAIIPNSPASAAGLKDGDIIIRVDNQELTESNPLARIIRQYNPGDTVSLTILRDKKEQTVSLPLGTLGN